VKRNDRIEAIARVPLFSSVKRKTLREIDSDMSERTFAAGSEIATEGKLAIGFFVITEGEAEVSVGRRPVNRLGPGDHFGEIALLAQTSRSASVRAVSDMRCMVLSAWKFRELVRRDPDLSWALLEALARQIAGT